MDPGSERSVAPGKSTLTSSLPVQHKAEVGGAPGGLGATDTHAAAALGTSGAGTTLPHLDLIQRSFGRHDVGQVQAHVDASAEVGARAMGAEAFAMGDHVAFAGQPDLHTAAHEAAHVVQQRGGVQLKGGVGEVGDAYEQHADAVADLVVQGRSSEGLLDTMAGSGSRAAGIQRKITIGGKPYDPKPDLPTVKAKFGKDMVEALTTMHNNGKPPDHAYATKDQLMTELSLRDKATQGMGKANASEDNLRYAVRKGDPNDGQLNAKFWKKEGFYQFTLIPGAKPADAIRSIFETKDNVLECNSTMVAIEYRSMLGTMGDDAFNKRFPGGKGLIISPHHVPMPDGSSHPIHEQGMIDTVTISGVKDLLPGDWVYFKNIADYGAKHPGGFWTGEHTMYLGDGKFQGFGTSVSTETEIVKKLLDNYNNGLPAAQQKKIKDVPGLQDYARRPVADKIVK